MKRNSRNVPVHQYVIPAKAGIQAIYRRWIPAVGNRHACSLQFNLTGNLRRFFFIIVLAAAFFICGNPIPVGAEEPPAASNEKISLDLKSIDIAELLRILSLKTGKTIVSSKDISGRISLYLNNVSFLDVLDIILVTQGWACDKKRDIIYIMSNAEYKRLYGRDYSEPRTIKTVKLKYAKPVNIFNAVSQLKSDIGKIVADEASGTIILIDIPEKLELLEKSIKELDIPLETAIYDLNYAKPADARTQLTAAMTPGTGEVFVDDRNGKAIISDLPKKMEKLGALVKELDEETRQVFIEAEIIQVTLSNDFKRGIDWEKVFSESKLAGLDFVGSFPVSPVLSAYQKISVGTVDKNKYKAIINLLDSYGDTEMLSQPKIAVVNNEEAHIMVGVRDAYVTQTLSQGQSTTVTSESIQFIDVGVKLKVVPTINKEGFITMKIKPEASSVRETISTALGSRIPIVQTSEAETVIKIKDGATIMLGGLLEQTKKDTTDGVPGLSRMPLVGPLFSRQSKERKKTELVVFITPHIIRGDAAKKGSEPEDFIPSSVMPHQLREKVVSKKLNEIENNLVPGVEPDQNNVKE
jgi:type II secretory pathway component GspD/PulD (secretin)